MIYYDLNVQVPETEKAIAQAKLLGLRGIALLNPASKPKDQIDKNLIEGIDIVSAILIRPKNPEELHAELDKNRKKFEIIAVYGGDYEVNRASCEDNRVDILLHPERGRSDSGMDHICAKSAYDNNVAIEISFNEILNARMRQRTIYFLQRNIYLCKKYNAPMIATSGAQNIWEMRAPRELASVASVLGLELNSAIESVSLIPEEKIRANREKLSGIRFGDVKVVG